MIDEACRMDPREWLRDEVEDDSIHMLEWNINNETKKNLQNRFECHGRDEDNFIVPDEHSKDVEGSSSEDDSDW